jgi:hypothetical protein
LPVYLDLNEAAEEYAKSGMPNKFDAKLRELYEFYFYDEKSDRIQKIKMFIDISALVKIVEEKFLAVQILIEKFWG